MSRAKQIRVGVLLLVLTLVGVDAWRTRRLTRAWGRTLRVEIHAMAAEASPDVQAYVDALEAGAFADVGPFLDAEAGRFRAMPSPLVTIRVGAPIHEPPPAPPESEGVLAAVQYSLRLRWYAFEHGEGGDVRLFVLYHAATKGRVLEHSIGIPEGRIGVLQLFADEAAGPANQVVVAHEILHTFGATDKYDARGIPLFPEGYAEPGRSPRTPQEKAEIMAGRVPLSPSEARLPASLAECVVGEATAAEMHWRVE